MMTLDELRALPAAMKVSEAAKALGISRTTAYQLIAEDKWPTTLLQFGSQYRVPLAGLLAILEVEEPPTRDVYSLEGAHLDEAAARFVDAVIEAAVARLNRGTDSS